MFEFATRNMAEQVITDDWVWNNSKVRLDLWTPIIEATNMENSPSSTWTKIVVLPLHLWSQINFKAIGVLCGDTIKKSSQVRNRIAGDGSRIPKKVTIQRASLN